MVNIIALENNFQSDVKVLIGWWLETLTVNIGRFRIFSLRLTEIKLLVKIAD